MATIDSLIAKATNLLNKCNTFTGRTDTNITSAVNKVIEDAEGKITPTGNYNITENGTYNVTQYAQATVDVPASGTDVSDTTATASDVLSGKAFYNASGTKTNGSLSITSITPSNSSPVSLSSGNNYKASGSGYAISSYSTASGSTSGTQLSSGAFYKISGSPYLYSTKPSGGMNEIAVSSFTNNETLTINTGLSSITNFFIQYGETNGRTHCLIYDKNYYSSTALYIYATSSTSSGGKVAFSTARPTYYFSIRSISGGTVVLNVPSNSNYRLTSGFCKWFAS